MEKPTLDLENKLWSEGYKYVAGIDEVGRGPWAGPVCVGIAIFPIGTERIDSVRDSKLLSKGRRTALDYQIKQASVATGVGLVDSWEIDEIGIQRAIQKATELAIIKAELQLKTKIDYLIFDGASVLGLDNYRSVKVNKGDRKHYSVSAASIIAKNCRDMLMEGPYAEKYPEYEFDKHVGYGTAKHKEVLSQIGPCLIHRRSYKPIKDFFSISMSRKKDWKYFSEFYTSK